MPAGQPAANRDVALIIAGASRWYCGLAFRFPDSYFNSDSAPKVGINLQPGKKKSGPDEGLRWRDTNGIGSAGTDGGARDGVKALVQTSLDGGEIVVAATYGET